MNILGAMGVTLSREADEHRMNRLSTSLISSNFVLLSLACPIIWAMHYVVLSYVPQQNGHFLQKEPS